MKNRVVVTGIGVVSPLGLDRPSTWENLVAGKSGVEQISSFDAEGYRTTIAAEVKDFDAASFVGRKGSAAHGQVRPAGRGRLLRSGRARRIEHHRRQQHARIGDDCQRNRGASSRCPSKSACWSRGDHRASAPSLSPVMLPDNGFRASLHYAGR